MNISRDLALKGLAGITAVGATVGTGVGIAEALGPSRRRQLERANGRSSDLGMGEECQFTEEDINNPDVLAKECQLNKEQFKKLHFSNIGKGDVKVEGWEDENAKITLKIEVVGETGEIKYTFKNPPANLTITKSSTDGGNKITIKKGLEGVFEGDSGSLSKVIEMGMMRSMQEINEKLDILSIPDNCRFDETDKEKSIECAISTEEDMKRINFSNKSHGELTIRGWDRQKNVKVLVERSETSDEIFFTFLNINGQILVLADERSGRITIETNRKFKFENRKMVKVLVDNTQRLRSYNHNLGDLNVPIECRFDEMENERAVSCNVSPEELKKIKFWNKGDFRYLELEGDGFTGVQLEVRDERGKMRFIFKNNSNAVKVFDDGENYFYMLNGRNDFEIRNNSLVRVRRGLEEIRKLGLYCTYRENGNNGTCISKTGKVKVYLNESKKGEVTVDSSKETFFFYDYEDGYNQGLRFSYRGTTTNSFSWENNLGLEVAENYQIIESKSVKYLIKKQ